MPSGEDYKRSRECLHTELQEGGVTLGPPTRISLGHCSVPNCSRGAYVIPPGKREAYCGELHANMARWDQRSTANQPEFMFTRYAPLPLPRPKIIDRMDFETPTGVHRSCFRCGHYGHKSESCPSVREECEHCGDRGHASGACPSGFLSRAEARASVGISELLEISTKEEDLYDQSRHTATPFARMGSYYTQLNLRLPPEGEQRVMQVK